MANFFFGDPFAAFRPTPFWADGALATPSVRFGLPPKPLCKERRSRSLPCHSSAAPLFPIADAKVRPFSEPASPTHLFTALTNVARLRKRALEEEVFCSATAYAVWDAVDRLLLQISVANFGYRPYSISYLSKYIWDYCWIKSSKYPSIKHEK